MQTKPLAQPLGDGGEQRFRIERFAQQRFVTQAGGGQPLPYISLRRQQHQRQFPEQFVLMNRLSQRQPIGVLEVQAHD